MKKFSKILIISFLALFLVAGSAMALSLIIEDNLTSVTLYDGDGDGAIYYVDSSGYFDGWSFVFTAGVSDPMSGEEDYPDMHLDAMVVSALSGGSLTITLMDEFSVNDDIMGFYAGLGGFSNSDVEFSLLLDGVTILDFDDPYTGAFSDTESWWGTIDPDGDEWYTLELVAMINASGPGQTSSFDIGVSPVPEPATMLLIGTGLIGIAGIGRKKFFK
jgi:hypothetical protein